MPRRTLWISAGLLLALAPLLAKALLPTVPMPFWDSDPLTTRPMGLGTGLTPLWSIVYDLVSMLGGVVLMACAGVGHALGRRWWGMVGLLLIGALPLLVHALHPAASIAELRIGFSWLSAMVVGVGIALSAREPTVRVVVLALFAGLVGVLAIKGAIELLIEHPMLVEAYQKNREQILAAQGWLPDSGMARSYQRRLMQAEATGWFGLANIYASLMAAMAAVWSVLALVAIERRAELGRWLVVAPLLGLLASITGVAMAGGKGGWVVLVLGLAIAGVLIWIAKRASPGVRGWAVRSLPVLIPSLCIVAIAAVLLRGMLGDHLGERSLLFRSFYFDGAWRIFVDSILRQANPAGSDLPAVTSFLGTGTAGFKEAYIVYKNPLATEDVASVHSVFLDWMATLGVLGLAWCALALRWMLDAGQGTASVIAHKAGTSALAEPDEQPAFTVRLVCLIAAIATVLSLAHVPLVLTLEEILARMGGLVVWCLFGIAVTRLVTGGRDGVVRLALFAGAAVLAVHGQIEQTFAWPGSVGVIVALIAASAWVPAQTGGVVAARTAGWIRPVIGVVGVLLIGLLGSVALGRVLPWQRSLERTAWQVWNAREGSGQEKFAALVRSAAELAQYPDWPTRREASRLLATAGRMGAPPELSAPALVLADVVVRGPVVASSPVHMGMLSLASGKVPGVAPLGAMRATNLSVGQNAWLGVLYSSAGDGPADRPLLARSAEHLEVAHRQDPTAPMHLIALMDVYTRLGDQQNAARVAREVIRVDALQKYDPLTRGLTYAQRARAEGLAGSGP